MPRRIDIPYRVIAGVAVPVETLGIAGVRDYRIRLRESAEFRVVIPCTVVVELGACVKELACEQVICIIILLFPICQVMGYEAAYGCAELVGIKNPKLFLVLS